jgi:hypothetical protein
VPYSTQTVVLYFEVLLGIESDTPYKNLFCNGIVHANIPYSNGEEKDPDTSLYIGTNGFYFASTKSVVELNEKGDISFMSGNYGLKIGNNGILISKDRGSSYSNITEKLFNL